MKIYIRDPPAELSQADFENHFGKYGTFNELALKRNIGFLKYDSEESAANALNDKHFIKGCEVVIDAGREFGDRRGVQDRRQFQNGPRDNCNYCQRCPVHGRPVQNFNRQKSEEHKKFDRLKIVIENIPRFHDNYELRSFAKSFDLNPVFAKLTNAGRNGIIEFASFEEKEEAMRTLDNQNCDGRILKVRDFFTIENPRTENNASHNSKNLIYDDLSNYGPQ